MTVDQRYRLVLDAARTLFVNGQATDQTVAAAERLGRALGLRAKIMARWGELQLQSEGNDGAAVVAQVSADPAGVEMERVASTMRTIDDVASARLAPEAAAKAIGAISRAIAAAIAAMLPASLCAGSTIEISGSAPMLDLPVLATHATPG